MHVGVIGLGNIGAFHARGLKELSGVERITVADLDIGRARSLASELGATAVSSMDEAIRAGVEAVVVATSTPSHAELVEAGVEARVPIFCEKPVALDLEAIDRILEATRTVDVPVQVGFQRRFDSGYQRAREMVESRALGRLYVVRVTGHVPGPPAEAYIAAAGGIYRDALIHDLDIMTWVTGQAITEVYADGVVLVDEFFERYDDVDTTVAVMRMVDGTLGILSGNRNDPLGYDVRMELYGSSDSIVVGWDSRTPLRSVEPGFEAKFGSYYQNFLERFGDAYRAEMAEFLRVARREVESPCTVEEARQSLRVALAAERSRRERRPVSVSEV